MIMTDSDIRGLFVHSIIVKAWLDGKTVEAWHEGLKCWVTPTVPQFEVNKRYRVKQKPRTCTRWICVFKDTEVPDCVTFSPTFATKEEAETTVTNWRNILAAVEIPVAWTPGEGLMTDWPYSTDEEAG